MRRQEGEEGERGRCQCQMFDSEMTDSPSIGFRCGAIDTRATASAIAIVHRAASWAQWTSGQFAGQIHPMRRVRRSSIPARSMMKKASVEVSYSNGFVPIIISNHVKSYEII